jgi:hypothetical protein
MENFHDKKTINYNKEKWKKNFVKNDKNFRLFISSFTCKGNSARLLIFSGTISTR